MTQEQKELLLKDLSARLTYGVKVRYSSTKQFFDCILQSMNPSYNTVDLWSKNGCFTSVNTSKIKPYLFPLSSMTEEQKNEWDNLFIDPLCERVNTRHTREEDLLLRAKSGFESTDYLDKNFLDYRGLIPMGLALDATGLNIY